MVASGQCLWYPKSCSEMEKPATQSWASLKRHLLFYNFGALGFREGFKLKGLMGEKCYCQMEVVVPELFKFNCVGEKKWKITLINKGSA